MLWSINPSWDLKLYIPTSEIVGLEWKSITWRVWNHAQGEIQNATLALETILKSTAALEAKNNIKIGTDLYAELLKRWWFGWLRFSGAQKLSIIDVTRLRAKELMWLDNEGFLNYSWWLETIESKLK